MKDTAGKDGGVMDRRNAKIDEGWWIGEDMLRGLRGICCNEGHEENGEESGETHDGWLRDGRRLLRDDGKEIM